MDGFRVEWWSGRKQNVRTDQTVENVRELLDIIPKSGHVRIVHESSSLQIEPDLFRMERQLA